MPLPARARRPGPLAHLTAESPCLPALPAAQTRRSTEGRGGHEAGPSSRCWLPRHGLMRTEADHLRAEIQCPHTVLSRSDSALFKFPSAEVLRAVSDACLLTRWSRRPGSIARRWPSGSGRRSAEPVRRPVEGARPRADLDQLVACGRARDDRHLRRHDAGPPRHGADHGCVARPSAAGSSNRPSPGTRYVPPRGRAVSRLRARPLTVCRPQRAAGCETSSTTAPS